MPGDTRVSGYGVAGTTLADEVALGVEVIGDLQLPDIRAGVAVAQRCAVQQADATILQRRGAGRLRRCERRGLRVGLQQFLHSGVGTQGVVQLHGIHIDALAAGIDQAGTFIGVGAERILDRGNAQSFVLVPRGHIGQLTAGGQLLGGGDGLGTGATGAHRVAKAIPGGRVLALAAGVEVAIPDHRLAPAHLAVGGAFSALSVSPAGGSLPGSGERPWQAVSRASPKAGSNRRERRMACTSCVVWRPGIVKGG